MAIQELNVGLGTLAINPDLLVNTNRTSRLESGQRSTAILRGEEYVKQWWIGVKGVFDRYLDNLATAVYGSTLL